MALPDTGKLVRDKIPQIIRDSGRHPKVVTLREEDIRAALEAKLQEEVDEFLTASNETRLEELADIYEVLLALALDTGATGQQLQRAAAAKRSERGGFDDRSWLVRTGDI